MDLRLVILILSIILSSFVTWAFTAFYYQKELNKVSEENNELKSKAILNENVINEVKLAFTQIAQESLKNQQEALLSEHSKDLLNKFNMFKAEEITPINRLLKEFKESIDNYQKSHKEESLDIKNAISTAEKYAKALTTSQNSKGEFGEQWLEQILRFANLEENIHYTKQFVTDGAKPDFVIKLPNHKNIIIDSKVILKNFIEYQHTESLDDKKAFLNDLTNCITILSKKNYEELDELNQPGFILMYIPIENCVNTIYTDYDFKKAIELANSRNIIIVGTSSLLVTLRLVNQLWASQVQYDNVQNIIKVGENLYNNISSHANNLITIQQAINKAALIIQTELNRFTTRNNGSIFKEAEKLKEFGISSKEVKSGKKIIENSIPEIFLEESQQELESANI